MESGAIACEQALLFGRVKRVSRERASAPLARSREAHFAYPNRRDCSQASGATTRAAEERGGEGGGIERIEGEAEERERERSLA